jgi:subtilase family serine protease
MVNSLKVALSGATMLACLALPAMANASPALPAGLTKVSDAAVTTPVHFDVFLPLRNKDKLEALLKAQQDPKSGQFHKWLTPAQFGAQFGPDSATIAKVANALKARGFSVQAHTRSLHVNGTASQVQSTFGARLVVAQSAPGTHHIMTTDTLRMPTELAAAGAQVFSFAPHVRHVMSHNIGAVKDGNQPRNRFAPSGEYYWTDLKQAYSYPTAEAAVTTFDGSTQPLDGTGATIAALMSSDVLDSDVQGQFDHENWTKWAKKPDPTIFKHVAIDGGGGLGGGAFDEASLDMQEEITSAPGSHVILYNIPDLSDGNVLGGYVTAVETNEADVLSSSFGECEQFYLPQYNFGQDFSGILTAEHEIFEQGNAQGMTFLASSGDNAGLQCEGPNYVLLGQHDKFLKGVSTPAADPAVTAVGGTNVVTTFNGTSGALQPSKYVGENAWADPLKPYDPFGNGGTVSKGDWGAGGGYSAFFARPDYQSLVNVGPGIHRAVPDVGMQVGGCPGGISKQPCNGGNDPKNGAGNTDRSFVVVFLNGGRFGLIGTSVSSPEFAGVLAHLVELKGRQGNVNNYLYGLAADQASGKNKYFHINIPGYNGVQNTNLNTSYSLSVGVGTPVVTNRIGAKGVDVMGRAQTKSNP